MEACDPHVGSTGVIHQTVLKFAKMAGDAIVRTLHPNARFSETHMFGWLRRAPRQVAEHRCRMPEAPVDYSIYQFPTGKDRTVLEIGPINQRESSRLVGRVVQNAYSRLKLFSQASA